MKWFKHFSNAHDSKDLTKVRIKYGADGYAIYWYCLELVSGDLGEKESITFELKHDAEVISHNLKIDTLRVEEIMKYMVSLGLFEDIQGTITCLKLAKYLDKRTTRNNTIHRIIDAYTLSETNGDRPRLSETNGDCPRQNALDTDTDTDKEITTLSGKPDVAREILEFLNEKTGRRFQPVKANLRLIKARLKESDAKTCRQVIAKKCRDWKGTDMEPYLRPATLFSAVKFAQYQGELGA